MRDLLPSAHKDVNGRTIFPDDPPPAIPLHEDRPLRPAPPFPKQVYPTMLTWMQALVVSAMSGWNKGKITGAIVACLGVVLKLGLGADEMPSEVTNWLISLGTVIVAHFSRNPTKIVAEKKAEGS